jgi:hydrogenase maturation protein HypF
MNTACSIHVKGVVQGVGFRPFVFRVAQANNVKGWVANTDEGVEIFVEGAFTDVEIFVRAIQTKQPSAASIAALDVQPAQFSGLDHFSILESRNTRRPTVRISPDLPVCETCLRELFDTGNPRYYYPYINCTNCGPRYSIIRRLPYDRPNTTMEDWTLDDSCAHEYHDPLNRRFHAQPVACAHCGPTYYFRTNQGRIADLDASIAHTVKLLNSGHIVAIKGIGGYHLACDARNVLAVRTLRNRKYRKEKPFALMVKDLEGARRVCEMDAESEALLTSLARPIVLARAKAELPEVAPENHELGLMLPYAPVHHLLFAAGAPDILVMTSGNRSSEPIAYEDEDAIRMLSEIADGFLIGERPIARRVDDSVVRVGAFGPVVLRRSRGLAPRAVAVLPTERPILALGADLKNTLTLVVDGQAFVTHHIGDLQHHGCRLSFEQTIHDLLSMYKLKVSDVLVVHDAHPGYVSTSYAYELTPNSRAVQHHRAHLASVLAEHDCANTRVIGISFDGTGFGDDGTIWGGEIFTGSLTSGFKRVGHLRPVVVPGGDAAARNPIQAAAGFLNHLEALPDLAAPPFNFPPIYERAIHMIRKNIRTFTTSSVGRLFDCVAALLGYTRENTFEGQAAIWLEHKARASGNIAPYPFPFIDNALDFRPSLRAIIADRLQGRSPEEIARAFQLGLARGLAEAITNICQVESLETVVLSGGVFQNDLLLSDIKHLLVGHPIRIWSNHAVPPNDGGISLGQAALVAFDRFIDAKDGCLNDAEQSSEALESRAFRR